LSNAVHRTGRILQIGSQQRSSTQFRYAAELVRNGRIGDLKTVYVGLPGDPGGDEEPEMPIPKNLNYDAWLGSTPNVYYTEKRVHPQNDYSRPGWLRMEQFGAGMITGWGAHHRSGPTGGAAKGIPLKLRTRRGESMRPASVPSAVWMMTSCGFAVECVSVMYVFSSTNCGMATSYRQNVLRLRRKRVFISAQPAEWRFSAHRQSDTRLRETW
jgi:hypothetical protein